MTKISFENISFGYSKKTPILDSISFDIQANDDRGHVCALMGESGAGKSTILKLLLGLLKPSQGKISITPQNNIVSYLPQEPLIFEHLSPLENAKYFSNIKHYKNRFDINIFNEVAELLELETVLNSKKDVSNLSGGEKQRIVLLRALSINPNILLLDEPCTGLDTRVKYQFLIGLKKIVEKYKLTVIYVTHLTDEVRLIADDVIYLMKNKEKKHIDSITYDSVSGFMEKPKNCEAGYIFHLPEMNLIRCGVVNNSVVLNRHDNYILFSDEVLSFNNDEGMAYQVVSTTNQFSFLELSETKDTIITSQKNIRQSGFLKISGQILVYDNNKNFIQKIVINQ
ncbi:MAG: ATP-binding cassette domain-containing protein [Candidatus Limimorpha sp.]